MELIARRHGADHLNRLRAEAGHVRDPAVARPPHGPGREAL
jgi:hypothetical protein